MTLGGVTLRRSYDRLRADREQIVLPARELPMEGITELPEIGIAVKTTIVDGPGDWTVCPEGKMIVRGRQSGDELSLSGGTKSLNKRFIDRKIPQWERMAVPVISDEQGVLAVRDFGVDVKRQHGETYVRIEFVNISTEAEK